jgi:rod shape-determining protein MreC
MSFSIIVMQVKAVQDQRPTFLDNIFSSISAPVLKVTFGFTSTLSENWWYLWNFRRLKEEIEREREERRRLQSEFDKVAHYAKDNEELRRLLKLSEKGYSKTVAAEVIGRDPSSWFDVMTLDRGFRHGVTSRMAALAPDGLVGRVYKVFATSCTIKLIFSENNAVPVTVGPQGVLGILYGSGGTSCPVNFVPSEAPVKEGDVVITSGQGRIYARGEAVGQVMRVFGPRESMYKTIDVRPAVDFSTLRRVLLVEKTDEPQ